jgi:hypothetical protein
VADIDFTLFDSNTFEVTITENPQAVTGNRAMLNRFEITFMTKRRNFLFGDREIYDTYGGDAHKFINKPQVLNNPQSISSALILTINETVESMQSDDNQFIPDTERIERAELLNVDVQADTVFARIQVFPVETESFEDLIFSLPLVSN